MPRLRNGMARVEFLAVRVEAEVLLARGHSCSSIYERFKADGKISMSYAAFHRHLKRLSPRDPEKIDMSRNRHPKPEAEDAATQTPPVGKAPSRVTVNGSQQAFDPKNAVPLSDLLTGE